MQSYFQKHGLHPALEHSLPNEDLELVVVIPSYNEFNLIQAVESILNCNLPIGRVEIIVILNYPESNEALQSFHEKQRLELLALKCKERIRILNLPVFKLKAKSAGVGMARKIGMDEAAWRFEAIGKDGIILCFDADCRCHLDYLNQVIQFFKLNPNKHALSIGFKHRMDDLDFNNRIAIKLYELHLRSYIGWQKYFDYPFAFQTLGSCMAVRSKAYQLQGGMNKRQAGEDFYFLHKFSSLGQLGELNQALVYPSGRISDRVPFGTGKAVNAILNSEIQILSYNSKGIQAFCSFYTWVINSWEPLKHKLNWKAQIESETLLAFLMQADFDQALYESINQSTTENAFAKRVGRFLNSFRLMKFLHLASEREYPMIPVESSAKELLIKHFVQIPDYALDPSQLLELLEKQIYLEINF